MALSQKHIGKLLVPWFCRAEWNLVYDKIYGAKSTIDTKREALEVIYVWKARTPLLPCGIEGTFIILEIMLLDRDLYDDYNLRLLISTSIMRFLNLCGSYNKNQTTFLKSAREMKLPDWLITLRHDTAHAQHLPYLDILERAVTYSFDWLKREYWEPAQNELTDFVDSLEIVDENSIEISAKLEPLLSNYCYLNLITHPHWNYKQFCDIGDEAVQNTLLAELSELKNIQTITKNTKINRVLKVLWQNIENVLAEYQDIRIKNNTFVKLLLEEDVFLGSFDEHASVLNENNLFRIPRKFLFLWESMLRNMHEHKMFDLLITQLITLLSKSFETDDRKLIAAFWLEEIANGLFKCKMAQEIYNGLSKKDLIGIVSEDMLLQLLKEKCEEKYGRTRKYLNLYYLSEIPEIFCNSLKFKATVLNKPNDYTKYFITRFLDLHDGLQPQKTEILELLSLYNSEDSNENIDISKIYTVQDFDSEIDDVEETTNITDSTNEKQNWTKVSDMDFEKCPLGVLPWQSTKTNPLC